MTTRGLASVGRAHRPGDVGDLGVVTHGVVKEFNPAAVPDLGVQHIGRGDVNEVRATASAASALVEIGVPTAVCALI